MNQRNQANHISGTLIGESIKPVFRSPFGDEKYDNKPSRMRMFSGIKAACSSLMWKCAEKSIILTLNLSIIQLYLMSSNDSYWLRYSCRLGLNLIPPQTGRSGMLSGTTSNNPPGPAVGSHPLPCIYTGSCSHTAASGVGSVCWSDKYPSTTGGGRGGGETKREKKREKDKDLFSLRWESWTILPYGHTIARLRGRKSVGSYSCG